MGPSEFSYLAGTVKELFKARQSKSGTNQGVYTLKKVHLYVKKTLNLSQLSHCIILGNIRN